jgi:ribosomal protein S18 acetylase RimI-like enzyme
VIAVRMMMRQDRRVLQKWIAGMIGDPNKDEVASLEIDKYASHPGYRVFIAERDALAVGFGVIKYDPFEGSEGIAELGLFQIDIGYRGHGLGTELFGTLMELLKADGIRKIYTMVHPSNISAVCFWLKRGFEFEARLTKFNKEKDYYLIARVLSL